MTSPASPLWSLRRGTAQNSIRMTPCTSTNARTSTTEENL